MKNKTKKFLLIIWLILGFLSSVAVVVWGMFHTIAWWLIASNFVFGIFALMRLIKLLDK